MSGVTLRPLDPSADMSWFHALNEACVPEVNSVPPERFAYYIPQCAYARAAIAADGSPVGALLVYAPGADYPSLNYTWVGERYEDFWYIDRIMVSAAARGLGVGKAFYDDLFVTAKGAAAAIFAEVNKVPPNPISMAFHKRMGFEPVGEGSYPDGEKSFVFLRRRIA